MTLTETISLIEVVWTAPALIGLLFTSWLVIDLWRDRRVLHRSGWNGLAALQAMRAIRSEALIVLCHAIFTGVGLFALTQPPTPASAAAPSPLGIVLTFLFIGVPALLVIRSIGDRVVRQTIRRQVRERRP